MGGLAKHLEHKFKPPFANNKDYNNLNLSEKPLRRFRSSMTHKANTHDLFINNTKSSAKF